MKTALIVGATGVTGRLLTTLLLADDRYSKIILLVRISIDLVHDKLEQIFFNFEQPGNPVIVADELFCCLGTTIKKAGSRDEFLKIDYEYISLVAKLGYENGIKRFAMVSSLGANKNSILFYYKIKGLVEESVAHSGYESCFILRPALLPGQQDEFLFGTRLAIFFMKSFSTLGKYKAINARLVAKAMVAAMNSEKKGLQIIESNEIAVM